jgi:hypothetical protein
MNDIFIRYIKMPDRCHGFVMEDPDGNYNAYLDPRDSYEVQRRALAHEIRHIKRGHLRDLEKTVAECEAEANIN